MEGTKSMLMDADGDISSGRVVKVYAFFTAVGITVLGLAAIIVLIWADKAAMAKELTTYVMGSAGMFLTVATGTEIVQKITGK